MTDKINIFIYALNNTLLCTSATLRETISRYRSKDGFLYLQVTIENVFG